MKTKITLFIVLTIVLVSLSLHSPKSMIGGNGTDNNEEGFNFLKTFIIDHAVTGG